MRNTANYGLLTAMFLSFASTATKAEEITDLNPVVVTGTGTLHHANNSPFAINAITANELKNAGVSNLQEAMAQLTTSITMQTNGMGTFINFNGVSDDYILILVDGHQVTGDDRWNRISIDNIERIEILNGAASTLYGSDALAGVINIITNSGTRKVEASTFSKMLNNGRLTQDVNVDLNIKNVSSSTSYNHQQADNWQVNHYQAFDEGDEKVLKLCGRPMSVGNKKDFIGQNLKWKINDKLSAHIRGNYYQYKTLRPEDATYFTQKSTKDSTGAKKYSYTEKQAYTYNLFHESYDYGGGVEWRPSKKSTLTFDAHSDNFTSKYDYWQTANDEAREETRKKTRFVNEKLNGIFQLTPCNRLSAGLDFVQETLKSETDNIHKETSNSNNIYLQDEVNVRKWMDAVAGVRYTYNSNFGSNFTPNFGLFFHVKDFQLRLSYSKGYKTPTLSQLYATDQARTNARYTINNPDLKPEKNDFWIANLGYGNKRIKTSVSAYINKISDMINYRTLPQTEIDGNDGLKALYDEGWTTIRQRSNLDKATIKGITYNLKVLLPKGFCIDGGYTYTDSESETKQLNVKEQTYETTKSPVDKSVKNVGHLALSWDKTWNYYRLNVCMNGYAQDKRFSSTYGYCPGYGQWDLITRHTFNYNHVILEPSVGIENLFDKRDDRTWNSNFSTINPGRSFLISLAVKFKD